MTDHHHLPPWLIFVAEVSTGIGVGHALTSLPSWVGGGLSALVVGVLLRVLDPSLRRIGERIALVSHGSAITTSLTGTLAVRVVPQ